MPRSWRSSWGCPIMANKLGPCPHCAEPHYLVVAYYTTCDMHAVLCGSCGASGPRAKSEPEAVEGWNRREVGKS